MTLLELALFANLQSPSLLDATCVYLFSRVNNCSFVALTSHDTSAFLGYRSSRLGDRFVTRVADRVNCVFTALLIKGALRSPNSLVLVSAIDYLRHACSRPKVRLHPATPNAAAKTQLT